MTAPNGDNSQGSGTVPVRILIVDDEPAALRMMQRLLTTAHTSVATAATVDAALSMALINPPDVVLTDVNLKGESGLELCRRLRERSETSRAWILVMTAEADAAQRPAAVLAGANDFIGKPFDIADLRARVDAAGTAAAERCTPDAT